MAVVPGRFPRRSNRLRPDQSAPVREAVVSAWHQSGGLPEVDAIFGRALDELDALTAPAIEKGFVMAFMEFVEAVSDHLASPGVSARPLVAVRLWLRCIGRLDIETNEILATRQELAASVGVSARDVSRVMSELVRINAVRREVSREGKSRGAGVVRFFLNERVANHLPKGRREAAVAAAPALTVVVGGIPPSERRPRARSFLRPVL